MADRSQYWMFVSDHEDDASLDFGVRRRGPVPISTKHPEVVNVVKAFIEDHSAKAHDRRRTQTIFSNGASVADIRKNVLANVPALENISKTTILRMMKPANRSSRNAKRHSGLVDARVPPKRNESAKPHPDLHLTHAAVNYVNELVTMCENECVAFSCDDKNKINVGTLAVSRHFKVKRLFMEDDAPNYPDHDFPYPDSKLIPSGYMQMERKRRSRSLTRTRTPRSSTRRCRSSSPVSSSRTITKDKKGRHHISWPRTGPLTVFLQAARFHGSNSHTHAKHLATVLEPIVKDPIKPRSVVSVISDGGPDWSTKSTSNLYNYGRLWEEMGLDGLIIVMYAPRHSRYNPIERAWAPLSKWLAGVTLPRTLEGEDRPPSQQTGLSATEVQKKEMQVFDKAATKCAKYWHGKTYDGHKISVRTVPSAPIASDKAHRQIKQFVEAQRRRLNETAKQRKFHKELKFLMRHCVRRPYQLEFYKCEDPDCSNCTSNPVKATRFFRILKQLGGMIPSPVEDPSRNKGEYMTLLRLLENPEYAKPSMDMDMPSGKLTSCRQGCRYVFLNETDKRRHKKLFH